MILETIIWIRGGDSPAITKKHLVLMALQGLSLYSANMWLCYYASAYMVSGLIAVTVSTMIIPNMIIGKLYLNEPIKIQTVLAAMTGLVGVVMLFVQEFFTLGGDIDTLIGFALGFSSTFLSVIGTQVGGKVMKEGIPVVYATSKALLAGGLFSFSFSMLKDGVPTLPTEINFWLGLLYFLKNEIDTLLEDLKTETGELVVNILEKSNLLEIDQHTLAGAISEIKTVVDSDPKKQNEWKEAGKKALQKVRRASTRRNNKDDKTETHSDRQVQKKGASKNHDSKTKAK